MVELLAAQNVDITLAEKGVWRKKDQYQAPTPTRKRSAWWVTDGTQKGSLSFRHREKHKQKNATRRAVAWSLSEHCCVLAVWHRTRPLLASGFLVYEMS